MYISKEFAAAWDEWKQHKLEKYGMPYTPSSERKALAKLFQTSHGVEKLAIESIDHSIENNWSSIYIKPKENGQQNNNAANGTYRDEVKDAFSRRYQNGG